MPPISQPQRAEAPGPCPVVVVGGGLSGLVATHLLQAHGLPVLLLEARGRLGGRIHGTAESEEAVAGSYRFDLGPAWVWPAINPRVVHWLDRLGLTLFEQHASGAVLVELPGQPVQRHTSGFPQEPLSMRVQGGTMALVRALSVGLASDSVQTGTRLRALALAGGGDAPTVALDVLRDGEPGRLHARAVVLAAPPRVLAAGVDWQPPLPATWTQRWAATPTWMAGQAKLLVTYATPFWRERGLSGTAISRVGPLAEVHDAGDAEGRSAALFGFVGVPAAVRRRAGDAALKQAAVQQLVRLFGPEAARPLALHLQDWAREHETATAADLDGAGGHPSPSPTTLPGPWGGRVILAGSEFAADYTGYLEGAVIAAERAAGEALAAL